MQKVILKKRLLAAREKDGPMQFLMDGTECYMDDNRANYLAALGEVEKVGGKSKKKPAKKSAPDAGGEDAGVDAEPDL